MRITQEKIRVENSPSDWEDIQKIPHSICSHAIISSFISSRVSTQTGTLNKCEQVLKVCLVLGHLCRKRLFSITRHILMVMRSPRHFNTCPRPFVKPTLGTSFRMVHILILQGCKIDCIFHNTKRKFMREFYSYST